MPDLPPGSFETVIEHLGGTVTRKVTGSVAAAEAHGRRAVELGQARSWQVLSADGEVVSRWNRA